MRIKTLINAVKHPFYRFRLQRDFDTLLDSGFDYLLLENYVGALEDGASRREAKLHAIQVFVESAKRWSSVDDFIKEVVYPSERYEHRVLDGTLHTA